MIIILILIVCAVLSYILYNNVEKKYLFGLECAFGCVCLVCISGICVCIPWCVIAWSPSINDIEKSKVDAQREAIVSALNMEDRDQELEYYPIARRKIKHYERNFEQAQLAIHALMERVKEFEEIDICDPDHAKCPWCGHIGIKHDGYAEAWYCPDCGKYLCEFV